MITTRMGLAALIRNTSSKEPPCVMCACRMHAMAKAGKSKEGNGNSGGDGKVCGDGMEGGERSSGGDERRGGGGECGGGGKMSWS